MRTPDEKRGPPTYAREAEARGINEILLGTRDGGGVSFVPKRLDTPIFFHDVTRLLLKKDGAVD